MPDEITFGDGSVTRFFRALLAPYLMVRERSQNFFGNKGVNSLVIFSQQIDFTAFRRESFLPVSAVLDNLPCFISRTNGYLFDICEIQCVILPMEHSKCKKAESRTAQRYSQSY